MEFFTESDTKIICILHGHVGEKLMLLVARCLKSNLGKGRFSDIRLRF